MVERHLWNMIFRITFVPFLTSCYSFPTEFEMEEGICLLFRATVQKMYNNCEAYESFSELNAILKILQQLLSTKASPAFIWRWRQKKKKACFLWFTAGIALQGVFLWWDSDVAKMLHFWFQLSIKQSRWLKNTILCNLIKY